MFACRGTYIWRRIGYGLITLFIIVTLNFIIFRIMPGDPASLVLSPDFTPEMRQLLLEKYGLDKPLGTQYVLYLKSMPDLRLRPLVLQSPARSSTNFWPACPIR